MRDLLILILHILATVARLSGPGGMRAVVAESVLVKYQLLILRMALHRPPLGPNPGPNQAWVHVALDQSQHGSRFLERRLCLVNTPALFDRTEGPFGQTKELTLSDCR